MKALDRIKAWLKSGDDIINGLGTPDDPACYLKNNDRLVIYGIIILCAVMVACAFICWIIELTN